MSFFRFFRFSSWQAIAEDYIRMMGEQGVQRNDTTNFDTSLIRDLQSFQILGVVMTFLEERPLKMGSVVGVEHLLKQILKRKPYPSGFGTEHRERLQNFLRRSQGSTDGGMKYARSVVKNFLIWF